MDPEKIEYQTAEVNTFEDYIYLAPRKEQILKDSYKAIIECNGAEPFLDIVHDQIEEMVIKTQYPALHNVIMEAYLSYKLEDEKNTDCIKLLDVIKEMYILDIVCDVDDDDDSEQIQNKQTLFWKTLKETKLKGSFKKILILFAKIIFYQVGNNNTLTINQARELFVETAKKNKIID